MTFLRKVYLTETNSFSELSKNELAQLKPLKLSELKNALQLVALFF